MVKGSFCFFLMRNFMFQGMRLRWWLYSAVIARPDQKVRMPYRTAVASAAKPIANSTL